MNCSHDYPLINRATFERFGWAGYGNCLNCYSTVYRPLERIEAHEEAKEDRVSAPGAYFPLAIPPAGEAADQEALEGRERP